MKDKELDKAVSCPSQRTPVNKRPSHRLSEQNVGDWKGTYSDHKIARQEAFVVPITGSRSRNEGEFREVLITPPPHPALQFMAEKAEAREGSAGLG